MPSACALVFRPIMVSSVAHKRVACNLLFALVLLGVTCGQALASDRLLVTHSGGSTDVSETGPTSDSFTVVCDTAPSSSVTVTVTPDSRLDVGSGAGVAITLTFTTGNYNVPQTVTVTAVDDSVAQGTQSVGVSLLASSNDSGYAGYDLEVPVNITDNDSAGVIVTQSGGSTDITEGGATDTYTLRLNSQPTADVTVTVAPDSQATVDHGTLTFTTANWSTPQTVTVTAVNDAVAEGLHSATIVHSASSTDTNYSGISISDVVAQVTDNDTAGVTITESTGTTDVGEQGPTSDSYTVVLNTQPTADVTITVTPDGQATVDQCTLTFTPANWNTPQTVTVTAVNDTEAEGQHTSTITHLASSTDVYYCGISIRDVLANVTDNDTAGVTITESGGSTNVNEAGPTSDTYTVVLTSSPTANVTVRVAPDSKLNVGSGAGVAVDLTFTPLDWNVAQSVTVTPVNDSVAQGYHTQTITHQVTSTDPYYSGLAVPNVTVNVTDNDMAGVTISESDGMTGISEAGITDTYTVVLNTQPTADVTVIIVPDDNSTTDHGTLTFTSANWNIPQTVTVTANDDGNAEGSHPSTINHFTVSADPSYNGLSLSSVIAWIADNDTAGVTVTQSGGSTNVTEGGATDTYTIVLTSQPKSTVTITVTPDSETSVGSGAGVARTLTFTTGNWSTAQTITVTATNDSRAEGTHDSTITHTASSGDPVYSGIAIAPVVAHITDNDTLGITLTQSGGSTNVTEGGATDTYTIVLTSQPLASVTITVTPDSQSTVSSGTLTFTTANWNVAQTITVTAVNDAVPEGPHTSLITHSASSTDPFYSGIAISSVTAYITDNDIAGVTITESGGSTDVNEAGTTSDTYTVVLDAPPTANVTVTVGTDGQCSVSPATLTFTTANWSTPQTVTVTAVDDSAAEGAHTSVITHNLASTDSHYNGIAVPTVTAHLTDNDTAGVTVTESGGSTDVNEQGTTSDTYTVVLNTPPTANVVITVTSGASTTVSPGSLTFTPGNWNTPQTVTVTAVDDALAEGTHNSTITHSAASTDPLYGGAPIRNVIAHVTDNDLVGVTISETGGSTDVDEQGPTSDTYSIVLNTQPTANVIITVTPDSQSDVGSGAGEARSLTFTTADWNTPQTITVTAVDDANPEGAHTSTITHTASSTDMNYGGVSVRNVTVHVTDNDTVGVTISESGGSTNVNETGPTSDSYTIVLNTMPTANVTITVTPDDEASLGAGAGNPITLTFTTANWNVAQTVTVTAVDDAEAQGYHSATITHGAASTDPSYNGLSIRNVTARITDNDTAGITVTESGGSTDVNEQGATSDTYTLVLNTRPTANVVVTVASDAQTTVSPNTVTFTPANWNAPQTVTVTAVNDFAAEGAHSSIITHGAASTDANYNNLVISGVIAHVTDNDTVGVTISEPGGSTGVSESGPTSDTYTVVLNTQPSADVTITILPDVQTTVSPATLTFTPANWNVPQTVTVTAVEDALAEGAHISTIMHHAASTDTNYSGIGIRHVFVHVTDNDVAGVTIVESGGNTRVSEDGPTSDTYTVVLNTPPASANVVITVKPDAQTDVGAGGGNAVTLTFTPATWNVPQTVTVTAVDDAVAEGPHSSTITHTSSSIDPHYNAIVISNVITAVDDDDSASVVISEPNGSTTVNEAGPTSDTYTVVLSIAPTSNVTITIDPDGQTSVGAGAGQPTNLIFTPSNWNVPQTITVTAVDDPYPEGAHTSTISHTAASADLNYNGISIRNVITSVIDDDTAGVTISQSEGSTQIDETGPTSDTYTIHLNIPPTSNVIVTVKPDKQVSVGAGADNSIALTFTPVNWNTPQTVTVTAVDDPVAEGAHHSATITHTAASSDTNYNGITIASVVAIVTDNDTAGVTISEPGGSTVSEVGPTSDTYTICLDTPPIADVTITVEPDDQTTLGLGPAVARKLVFTPANWSTPQAVTFTAVRDGIAEGLHNSTIRHSSSSSDSTYNGISIRPVIVKVVDADIAGITITESGGVTNVNEQGPTADTYTVVLNTPPTADVKVTVSPDRQTNVGAGAGKSKVLTFTSATWNSPQTVTVVAVDDPYAEGPHASTISHIVASADTVYNGLTVRNVAVSVTDNDVAGITITESDGFTQVGEAVSAPDVYTVVLNTPPTGDVTIMADPDRQTDLGEGPGVPVTLRFTQANWNVPQAVTVVAVDDTLPEGVHSSVITHVVLSTDRCYNGLTRNVIAAVMDNDVAGVELAESGGSTNVSENGPTSDSYTIVLNTPPTSNVTISAKPDEQTDLGAGPGEAVNLTFTPANWNTPQTVHVTAVNDSFAEGDHTSTIIHKATSADRAFNGIAIRSTVVNVTDNDVAGITVTETEGSTQMAEQGPTSDTCTIVLNTPPKSNVTISVSTDVQTQVETASATLTFTPDNWNTPQSVTVMAVDDPYAEGTHSSTITFVAQSADPAYNVITIHPVTATIIDNDTRGVSLVQTGDSTDVDEAGQIVDTYDVVLNTQITSTARIIATPDSSVDLGAGPGQPITLTFTPADWNVPQTITVKGVNDLIPQGPHTSIIQHRISTFDGSYMLIRIDNVVVHITDDDPFSAGSCAGGGLLLMAGVTLLAMMLTGFHFHVPSSVSRNIAGRLHCFEMLK